MLDYRDHVLVSICTFYFLKVIHNNTFEPILCRIQASVRDIEELVDIGRKLNACSYYGTRKSIRQCQVMKSLIHL